MKLTKKTKLQIMDFIWDTATITVALIVADIFFKLINWIGG